MGFRLSAQNMAQKYNITGFIRNEPDGLVYIEAEGEEENLNKFLEWCKKGPNMAKIEKVKFEFSSELKKSLQFDIF